MSVPQYPNAVIFPLGRLASIANVSARMSTIDRILGPILGCTHTQTGTPLRAFNLTSPLFDDKGRRINGAALLFPTGHQLAKHERHFWHPATQNADKSWTVAPDPLYSFNDRPDNAVLFGYEKPDPTASTPSGEEFSFADPAPATPISPAPNMPAASPPEPATAPASEPDVKTAPPAMRPL